GDEAFHYKASADQPWITLKPAAGKVDEMVRLEVGADWEAMKISEAHAVITIETDAGEPMQVTLPVRKRPADVRGFVESDGHIAIEAPYFHRAIDRGDIHWQTLPNFGRTLGGVTAFPVTAPEQRPGGDAPRLEYDLHFFSAGNVSVEVHTAPSLDFQPGEGLRFAVSFDNEAPQIVRLGNNPTERAWEVSVGDGVTRLTSRHRIEKPGHHVLKLWMVTPGVVFERIVVDTGGLRPSYLGPPESYKKP
ncbi:MAG TPA: glycosyl hydrolase, partial [Gammaproteobacteria bacterium]